LLTIGAALVDPPPYGSGALQGFNPLWLAAGFCIVVAVCDKPVLRKVFSASWLVAIGVASYSIYLVHQPIIVLSTKNGFAPIEALAFAIAGGSMFWAFAERPFVCTRFKKQAITAARRAFTALAASLHLGDASLILHLRSLEAEDLKAIA
jgi:peptidoglycan/LPS O-acetylase OafA/YrhL